MCTICFIVADKPKKVTSVGTADANSDSPASILTGVMSTSRKCNSPALLLAQHFFAVSETGSSVGKHKSSPKLQSSSKPAVCETESSVGKPKSSDKLQSSSKPAVGESVKVRLPKMPPSSYIPPTKRQRLDESFHEVQLSQQNEDPTWSKCCNQLAAHNNLQGTCLVVQALHPFGVAISSTGFG